jgi:hypothetical protein
MLLKHLIFFHESKEKNLQALGSDNKKSKEKKHLKRKRNGNILKYFFKNISR